MAITYSEPSDYFPKELRKKYGLGEYSEIEKAERAQSKKQTKKPVKKQTGKKK